mmetsp:Transcript_46421/g.88637  ORF Transcript_46421/g.88637 Transcript_46421/m.88637 type:complete len:222 (+) Transcript_46421:270-935(+)
MKLEVWMSARPILARTAEHTLTECKATLHPVRMQNKIQLPVLRTTAPGNKALRRALHPVRQFGASPTLFPCDRRTATITPNNCQPFQSPHQLPANLRRRPLTVKTGNLLTSSPRAQPPQHSAVTRQGPKRHRSRLDIDRLGIQKRIWDASPRNIISSASLPMPRSCLRSFSVLQAMAQTRAPKESLLGKSRRTNQLSTSTSPSAYRSGQLQRWGLAEAIQF